MGIEKTDMKNNKHQKGFNIKLYIRDFLLFVDNNLIKNTGILLVVSIILIALLIQPIISTTLTQECEGTCRDSITLISEYWSKLQVLLVTAFAGVVPYIYAPVIGFVGYIVNEVYNLAFIIKGHGYLVGIGIGIVPLLLNVLAICVVVALGIYICKTVTVGYRISNVKNMNFMNFRIKLYEAMQKEDKVKVLTEKREAKIAKLEKTKQKLQYLQILNTGILICVIQFISVLIQQILL